MARTLSSSVFVYLVFISLTVNTDQNVRRKRQIFADQPRIVTENGHLVFKAGSNRNITFQSGAGGGIYVDGYDLKFTATQVKANKDRLDSLHPSSGSSNVTSRLVAVETQLSGMRTLPQQIATFSTSLDGFRAQQQLKWSSANNRLSNLESQIGSGSGGGSSGGGGGTSGGSSSSESILAISQLTSRVQNLENRARSRNRQMRRIRRAMSRLSTRVNNLITLLTRNECLSNPCQNGGTCVDMYNGFICRCPSNFKGTTCTQDVNECGEYTGTSLGCQNGATCINFNGGFRCQCARNWHGIHCTEQHDDCTGASHSELCGHGSCINEARVQPGQPKYRCICEAGWTKDGSDPACNVDINECNSGRHCSVNPPVQCFNVPGSFFCGSCPQGYEGNGYSCSDVNECLTNNGGCSLTPRVDCINTIGSRTCGSCPSGYQGNGITCVFIGHCQINNGGCHPDATCTDDTGGVGRICTCPAGYVGSGVGASGCQQQSTSGACRSNPCQNGAQCLAVYSTFNCVCQNGYTGPTCATRIDPCDSNPCQNGGTCTSNGASYTCVCTDSYTGNNCQTRQEGCGSYLSGETGSFRYPRSAGTNYPHRMNCAWVITTSTNKILHITFPSFSLESSANCAYDFLQIHDGPSASAYMIGKYCGNTPPNGGSINSTHNQLYLWFLSDASISSDGFEVQWVSLDPVCGGVRSGSDHGSINSPGYPGNYPHNRDCVWTVSVSPGKNIMFQFAHLAIEQHSNCSYDYLEIRDGELSTSPVLERFCSSITPAPLQTTGPYAYLRFHTDQSISDRGFHITYAALDSGRAGCGGALTEDEGQFTSPGYPSPYSHNSQCIWIITVSSGNQIQLSFTSFDLETDSTCDYDYVQVRDGGDETSPNLGTFCGSNTPSSITSTGNVMFVKFQSDESITGNGFQAQYTTGCGGLFTDSSGQIQSPSYPNSYPHNKRCRYVIQVADGMRIRLNFQAFSLEDSLDDTCSYDYVRIYNGPNENSPALGGSYCGQNRPDLVRSTGNILTVLFRTDGSVSNTGFMATYTSEDASNTQECGGIINSNTGVIQSPGFPNTYAHGVNCTWFITVDSGYVVRLYFQSINLEGRAPYCPDYVDVYDNTTISIASRIGRYCGSTVPRSLTSTDTSLIVVFRSDHSIAREGFSASFIALNVSTVCGSTLTSSSGVITSPNFPNSYPHGRDCEWVVQTERMNQVWVNITNFQLEGSSVCRYDYLEFRNGGSSTSPLIGKYCGTTFPQTPFVSHSNNLYIRFVSDLSVTRSGFRLEYNSGTSGCGGDLTSPSGGITSPNYPQPYFHIASCTWTITVSKGSRVYLIFQDFQLERHSSCRYDYVQIRENGPVGPVLRDRICGNGPIVPRPIISSSNKMWITMVTDGSVAGRGFRASYYTECNNRLRAYRGVIESPNFPSAYPHTSNCTWYIEAPIGNKINISFAAFHLERSRTCRYDRLEVFDGNSTTSPSTRTFCGSSIPEPFQTNGSVVALRFRADYSIAHMGFRIEYVVDGCGRALFGSSGVIQSPNYPNPYPHRRECLWTITAPTGKSVVLNISDFDLESHSRCNFDTLEVYAGLDTTGPRLTQLCHTQTSPQILTATGNVITLRFKSDSSISGRGFRASYSTVDGGCGGNFSTAQGTIMSKNYPNNYPHNTECEWLITVAPYHVVKLNFTDFALEGSSCNFDYVKLYDGANTTSRLIRTLCGERQSLFFYRSTGNQMFIRMRTDSSVTRRGFKATYITGCGATLNADQPGVIQSPNYINGFITERSCIWLLLTSDNSRRITLTFTSMDIPSRNNCQDTYVAVGDPQVQNLTDHFCGNVIPPSYTSYGSGMMVKFKARGYTRSRGFRATYTSATSACGGTFTGDSGRFNSPGYPDNYPVNTVCIWKIQVSVGNSIVLSFPTFSLEPSGGLNDDYVEIWTPDLQGTLVGRYIGQNPPSNLTALHGAWIKFRSNDQYPGQGFTGEWNTEYGGTFQGNTGQLASPMYPAFYPALADYTWTIVVDSDKIVRIVFNDFQLEGHSSSNCVYDYVQLINGDADTGTEIGKYCATQNPGTIYSTTNVVTVNFISDRSVQRQGFLMTWNAVNQDDLPSTGTTPAPSVDGCGGNLIANDTWNSFTSPGNRQGYSNNLDCIWQITVPEGNSIMANITYIDMEGHSSCSFDYIAFYNGLQILNFQRIGRKYCGQDGNVNFIRSLSNTMSIKFHTDYSVNRTGFEIAYKKGCGGVIRTQAGQITSPGFPNNYPANANCSWNVAVRTGKTILLTFNRQFNIAGSGTCTNDYLSLRNGYYATSPPLYIANTTSNTNGKYCGSVAPQDLETSGVSLLASFMSDGSGSGVGFSFNFTEKSLACGGQVFLTHRLTSRFISSPNFPTNYPQNVDCIWVVFAPSTERIQFDFETLEIEQHSRCAFDNVQLRDGGTIYSPPLGPPVCGSTLPSTQVSTGNMLFVRFITDSSITRRGFNGIVSLAECGGRITGVSGEISSPNYPSNYDNNADCEWVISVATGHYIIFNVSSFNLQRTTNCTADFVEIRDGNSTSNSLFNRCGYVSPRTTVRTSDNTAYVHFRSDGSSAANGFKLIFTASLEECGGELTTPSGTFTSPSYPGRYSHYRRCIWVIRVAEGRRVTLTFDDFDLEASNNNNCDWDYISIYNGEIFGSPFMGRYCGTNIPPVIESSGNSMGIIFRTDGSVSGRGFRASYTSNNEATCGGRLTSLTGNITFGSYNHSEQCIWHIQVRGSLQQSLVFNFHRLNLEYHTNCAYDRVEIREGDSITRSPVVGRFCGNVTNRYNIVIPANSATVMFRSDVSIAGDGFNLVYRTSNCGGILTAPQGVITSPNYPNNYDHNDGCAWIIRVPEGSQIRVNFTDFDFENHTNCQYDSLQIQNGGLPSSPVIGKYCGRNRPPVLLSQSNQIRIVMVTDISESAGGFRLTYASVSEGCGGMYHASQGNIASPNYPLSYPYNIECSWDINVAQGYRVKLQFVPPFDLEITDPCNNDYVEAIDYYPNGTSVSRGRYCSNLTPPNIYSSATRMVVIFRSNARTNGHGFAANWTSECGGLYTADTGYLYSPNYPNHYPNNIVCNYTISPPGQKNIALRFNHFELEGSTSCRYDSLRIFQGNDSNSRFISRLCGRTQPDTLSGLGTLFLQFVTDSSQVFDGFYITYSSEECGGVFTTPNGAIHSPLFPTPYHHNANCSWSITVAEDRIVALKFSNFDLEQHPGCYFDSLSIYDGSDLSSDRIGKFCGNIATLPDIIRTSGNQMFINFLTDGSVASTGFMGSYWSTYGPAQGCGGVLRQSSGTISSVDGDGDGQYEDYLDCEWTIYVSENRVATLTFGSMDVESSTNCVLDYVKVYDGPTKNEAELGTYCGTTVPPTITASTNAILVVFHTDLSIQGAGFTATYGEIDMVCGGSFNATTTPATISSPNYPNPYTSGVRCSWIIDSGSRFENVKVELTDLQLQDTPSCQSEYLLIRDRPSRSRESHYCGTNIPQPFYSQRQRVGIIYSLIGNSNSRGFQLKYSVAGCNRNYTGSGGEISSPNYPGNYPHNQDCRINITGPANTYLSLYFYDFQTESHSQCRYDYIEVRNSSNDLIVKRCGATLPSPFFLPDNRAFIRFRTDYSISRQGFSLTYVASTQASGCGGNITDLTRGAITSPNYPGNSTEAMTCTWYIQPPRRLQLRVFFAFLSMADQSDCYRNYVDLGMYASNVNSPTFARFCTEGPGENNAFPVSQRFVIRYVNSGYGSAPIFHIRFHS